MNCIAEAGPYGALYISKVLYEHLGCDIQKSQMPRSTVVLTSPKSMEIRSLPTSEDLGLSDLGAQAPLKVGETKSVRYF